MQIEKYSSRYFDDVKSLIENFYAEAVSEYDGEFDPEQAGETVKSFGERYFETAFLLIIDDKAEGILFGMDYNSMAGSGRIFQEIMWYVNEPFRRYGVTMLKRCCVMLKDAGFDSIIMAVLENSKTEKLKRFYSALGYRAIETHYMKAL